MFFSSVKRGSCDWLVEVTLHSSWREKPSSRSRCFLLTVSSTFWIGANWAAVKMPASHWLEIWPLVKTDHRCPLLGARWSISLPQIKTEADTHWLDFELKLPPMFVPCTSEIKQKVRVGIWLHFGGTSYWNKGLGLGLGFDFTFETRPPEMTKNGLGLWIVSRLLY